MNENKLREIFREFIAFFTEVGEDFWLSRFQMFQSTEVNCTTINSILQLFGGMGSLNDLCILKINGHRVTDEQHAHFKLNMLRNQLYSTATDLKKLYNC